MSCTVVEELEKDARRKKFHVSQKWIENPIFYQRDGENGAGQKWATKKLIIVRLTEHN